MTKYKDELPGVYTIQQRDLVYYVGQSIGMRNRARQHRGKLKRGQHENVQLQECYNQDPKGWAIKSVHIIPPDVVAALDKATLKLLLLVLERETIDLVEQTQAMELLNVR
jgi:hypothetical protein